MPINKQYKLLFIHIPKTAGTSIELYFNMQHPELFYQGVTNLKIGNIAFAPQHLRLKDFTTPDKLEYYNNYHRFAVVRNPYDRVLSEYFWQNKHIGNFYAPDFEVWLKSYYSNIDTDHKLSQTEYLYVNGKKEIHTILKQETLGKDFAELLKRINYKGNSPLAKVNISSNRPDFRNMLSENCKTFIYEMYKDDFINFNYER